MARLQAVHHQARKGRAPQLLVREHSHRFFSHTRASACLLAGPLRCTRSRVFGRRAQAGEQRGCGVCVLAAVPGKADSRHLACTANHAGTTPSRTCTRASPKRLIAFVAGDPGAAARSSGSRATRHGASSTALVRDGHLFVLLAHRPRAQRRPRPTGNRSACPGAVTGGCWFQQRGSGGGGPGGGPVGRVRHWTLPGVRRATFVLAVIFVGFLLVHVG